MLRITCLWLLVTVTVFSCKEDEGTEIIDNEKPVITAVSPQQNGVFWNNIQVEFTIDEDVALDKAELYVDNELASTFTSAPFKTDIDISSLADGPHLIKITAQDEAGNVANNLEIAIEVNNTLLNVNVGSVATIDGNRYIFITDNNGNVVELANVAGMSSKAIKRPEGFNDTTFAVHKIELMNNDVYKLQSYFNVTPGELNLGDPSISNYRKNTTPISLNFTDIQTPNRYLLSFGEGSIIKSEDLFENQTVYINDNTDEAYLLFEAGGEEGYLFMDNLSASSSHNFSLNDLNYDMSDKTLTLSDPDYHITLLHVNAYKTEDLYSPRKTLFLTWNDSDTLKAFTYPLPQDEDMFAKKSSLVYVSSDDGAKEYSNEIFGSTATTFHFIDADLKVESTDINNPLFESTGEFDHFQGAWINVVNGELFGWEVISRNGSDIVFPTIPSEILEVYPWITIEKFSSGGILNHDFFLYERDNCEGYGDYLSRAFGRGGVGIQTGLTESRSMFYHKVTDDTGG